MAVQTNPPQRPLRVYAFDPSRGARRGNLLTIQVPYEDVKKGPVGRKVAVIDYDASNKCYYEAVDLDAAGRSGQSGVAPSEANPQFHQQMVYAVVMDTLRRFQTALGRDITWRKGGPKNRQLHIYPHAFQEANAFYDPDLRALLFGYFKASEDDAGENLPGQNVFTCLSHDIIVHETVHACLDGIREHYSEATGPDAAAFHEGFADIIALLQHFSFKDTLLETIQRTGGLIHRPQLDPRVRPDNSGAMIQAELGENNPMVDLARQFGEAMGMRKALREALGTTPDPSLLETTLEPHDRGAILVAAVFDAFFSVYIDRTRDLMRIAYPDGRTVVPNFVPNDLANRLADEAARTAQTIQQMCLTALDYSPAVDITFGDYLRALVTASKNVVNEDAMGYRAALINAFRARGIRPEGVVSYSEEALSWEEYKTPPHSGPPPDFGKLWRHLSALEDDDERDQRENVFRTMWTKADMFAVALGLDPAVPIAVESIHTTHSVRPDGSLRRQIVAVIVQTRDELIVEDDPKSGKFKFRGGTTLLINREGDIQYSIKKPISGNAGMERLRLQREYRRHAASSFALAPYIEFNAERDMKFGAIHRGY